MTQPGIEAPPEKGSVDVDVPPISSETIDSNTRRPARARVVNVLKRIRSQNPRQVLRRFSRSATDSARALTRLNEKELEFHSEVSELTDTFPEDDLSLDNGKGSRRKQNGDRMRNNGETSKTHPGFSPSSMASFSIKSSKLTDYTLSESIGTWLDSLSCLAKSKEMNSFLNSSNKLAVSAAQTSMDVARDVGSIVVHTALLPVTLPLRVTASATDLVFNKGTGALHFFCDNFVPIVVSQKFETPRRNPLITSTNTITNTNTNAITNTARTEGKGGTAPTPTTNQHSSSKRDDFLDRLRLDSQVNSGRGTRSNARNHYGGGGAGSDAIYSIDADSSVMQNTNTKFSILLLRVEDIYVKMPPSSPSQAETKAVCVDLHKDFSDERLVTDALTQLAERAMNIACSNEAIVDMLPLKYMEIASKERPSQVDWKAVGQTKKDYKRLRDLPETEFYDVLSKRILTWSGKYLGKKYYGSENPFFASRGVVTGKPIEVLNLLWNSDRTSEYNKHCVRREDKFSVLDDETVKVNGFFGAKIIESETKIPMTKMSVGLCALMCAKMLGDRPEDGYVIFSRSLSCGEAGNHPIDSGKLCQSSNNEVIIGINIMRSVPGRPDLSDLVSISQVDASILPPFLKARVGIMASEDFFKHARKALKKSKK